MSSYALVSAVDADVGRRWCTLAAAQSHVGAVGNWIRANELARNSFLERITDCERNVRAERMRLSQQKNNASLSEITPVVLGNHHIWSHLSEFETYRDGGMSPQTPSGAPKGQRLGKGKHQPNVNVARAGVLILIPAGQMNNGLRDVAVERKSVGRFAKCHFYFHAPKCSCSRVSLPFRAEFRG